MHESLIVPRWRTETFDGGEYGTDIEENAGFRTPPIQEDIERAASNAMFDQIRQSYQ